MAGTQIPLPFSALHAQMDAIPVMAHSQPNVYPVKLTTLTFTI